MFFLRRKKLWVIRHNSYLDLCDGSNMFGNHCSKSKLFVLGSCKAIASCNCTILGFRNYSCTSASLLLDASNKKLQQGQPTERWQRKWCKLQRQSDILEICLNCTCSYLAQHLCFWCSTYSSVDILANAHVLCMLVYCSAAVGQLFF